MLINSFGLGITQAWLWLFFLNGPLLYASTAKFGGKPETVFVTFLLFNSLSYLIVARTGGKISPLRKKPQLLIFGISLMIAGTLIVGLMTKELHIVSKNLLITLGTLGSGFGSALLISALGEQFSTLPAHRSSLSFGLAVSVGTVIFLVINRLPLTISVIVTACIPVLAGILLLRKTEAADEPERAAPIPHHVAFPLPTQLVVLVMFYLAGGLMQKMIASGVKLGFYESFWVTNIVYFAICLLTGLIVYFNPGIDLRYIYRPILPLLGIGFVLFSALQHSFAVVPFTFLQSGFALFDLYTWVLLTCLAASHRYPVSVVGWGMFLITAAILTGELLFTGIFSTITMTMKQTDLISLFAAILMFAGTMVFHGERETLAGWNSLSAPGKPNLYQPNGTSMVIEETACASDEANCNLITEEVLRFSSPYNLTPREKQILLLLLEGRNNPYIREKLNVSNNTLKTHLRNLYRKLSVNDRQELLSLYVEFKTTS